MEAIRKQASKLREQVAKQQEAVFKQISRRFSHEPYLVDEDEIQCHQKLQMLYASTKAAKHLQRDIVRGLEAYIGISSKQMEVVKRLSEDCCKYGTEYQNYGSEYQNYGFPLASAAVDFGTCHILMEKERDGLLRILGDQVYEPIRAMIMSAPLEDARLLTYRYERIRQDVEAQIAEVVRRQLKSKETGATTDVSNKLQNAESKLTELRTTLSALGREATAAMMAVESQQQVITFERLLSMVEAERAYHQNVATILDKLHDEMVQTRENHESLRQAAKPEALQFQTGREELKTTQSDSESVPEAEMETSHSQTRKEDLTTSQSHEEPVAQAARTVTVQSQTAEENFKTDQPHHESESLDAMTETVQYEIGKEGSMTIQSQQDQVIQDRITLAMQFPTGEKGSKTSLSGDLVVNGQHPTYFVGQVIHPFDAQADGELSFSVGDYVVVRQVAPNGWSEGECKGKSGWFPSAYVEHRDKAPASKVIEPNLVT